MSRSGVNKVIDGVSISERGVRTERGGQVLLPDVWKAGRGIESLVSHGVESGDRGVSQ